MPKRRHEPFFALEAVLDDSYRYGAGWPRKTWEYLRDILLAMGGERRRRWAEYLAMEKQAAADRASYQKLLLTHGRLQSSYDRLGRSLTALTTQANTLAGVAQEFREKYDASQRQVDVHSKVIAHQHKERLAIAQDLLTFKKHTFETLKVVDAILSGVDGHDDIRRQVAELVTRLRPALYPEPK